MTVGPEIGVISSFDTGYNFTDFENRRTTYFAGVNVNYRISDHFSVTSGVQYLRLGYQHETSYEFPEGVKNRLVGKIDYLILPLEVKYHFGKANKLYTSLGILFGYNIKAVQDYPDRIGGCEIYYLPDISDSVDDFGIGGNVGLGYTVFSNDVWAVATEINGNIVSEITQLESFGSGSTVDNSNQLQIVILIKNMRKVIWFWAFIFLIFNDISAQVEGDPHSGNEMVYTDLFNAVENDSIACYRIPALITAPNGDLIAAIDERAPNCNDLRDSRDINIVIRRSTDNGDSWFPMETIVDYPDGQSASDPSMIVDEKTGEIFLFFNFMNLDKERNVYYLRYIKSSDNGKSWSEPIDITGQISKPEWHNDFKFITSGRGFQTAEGKLVHTMVNLQRGVHLFASDNHGKTWYLIDSPIKPGDESKVIELPDGRWMINSRVAKIGQSLYPHF